MRTIHRITMMFAVQFALYLGATGSLIQAVDLKTLLSHAPATDLNQQSIREGINGPPNFMVITTADYDAPPLPAAFNPTTALATTLHAARTAIGPAALDYVELRMVQNRPVGQILSQGRTLRFDAATGAPLPLPATAPGAPTGPGGPRSLHDQIKSLHRMDFYGDWALWLNLATGAGLFILAATGLILYFQMLSGRRAINRRGLFWSGGGLWRALHRWLSILAAAFLIIVAISGALLAIDNIAVEFYLSSNRLSMAASMPSAASPLQDADLAAWLRTTLAAAETAAPDAPIKAIRLRFFAQMPQGVVIAGGPTTRQLVFNATTGAKALEYEPGYPVTGFPFGWQEHEIVKEIHRGDYFGLTGRWMDLLAGLSLVFLSISGIVMYADLYAKRRRLGRGEVFWK